MKKNLNRYPIKEKKIYFRKGKNIISKNKGIFLKKYNAHEFIKILRSDFKLIEKNMNNFTHFNIQYSEHKLGKNYLIMKIHKQGYFNGSTSTYRHAILDSNNFILAKCLFVKNNIDYVDLKKKAFKHSLSNIKNVNTLKKSIKKRYKKTLAHLSDTQKLSLGIAITELKIIKRF
tara:strand:- start:75 stop:596 length:522 start_codon:yes stop_codon:yes gene_type:complete